MSTKYLGEESDLNIYFFRLNNIKEDNIYKSDNTYC